MSITEPYDYALGMWIEPTAMLRLNHLAFLRYLAERGRLEHRTEGASSGPVVGEPAAVRTAWTDEEAP